MWKSRASCRRPDHCLVETEDEVLAYLAFPPAHWRPIYSTKPLERLMKVIARRADVVGILPTRQSVLRLVGSVLMEQDGRG